MTDAPAIPPGTPLGHYQILHLVGSGGMSEVYAARDTRLDRDVAVKVLPAKYGTDEARLRRFEHEGRAMCRLNHPNVVSVYDVGHEGSMPYIVTELLQGETLRERLAAGRIPIRRAVAWAIGIARGLASAHEAGIVHRDLKPANVFVTRDSHVKILDFGLAKLVHPEWDPVSTEENTISVVSHPGTIVGSVGYMSPEQVEGAAVDHRSDLFSLGAILYEMLTGEKAFRRGSSTVETLHSILKDEPPDLRGLAPEVDESLARIVRRCLAKKPDDRFDTARDLAFSLEDAAERSRLQSGSFDALRLAASGPVSRWVLGFALAGVIVTALTVSLSKRADSIETSSARLPVAAQIRVTRLTTSGTIVSSLMLRGKQFLLYSTRIEAGFEIRLRQLATGSEVVIVPAENVHRFLHDLSADDAYAYYIDQRFDRNNHRSLWRVPVLGGEPALVVEANARPWALVLSPDGKQLAVATPDEDPTLLLMDPQGRNRRTLTTLRGTGRIIGRMSWSPDGRTILATARDSMAVIAIDTASGATTNIALPRGNRPISPLWRSHGTAFIVGTEEGDLLQAAWPDGRVTHLLSRGGGYRASRMVDADTLLAGSVSRQTHLWTSDTRTNEARQLSFGSGIQEGDRGVGWTPDGRVLFTAEHRPGTSAGIWIADAEGNRRMQLTSPPDSAWECNPRVTDDGRYLLYDRYDRAAKKPWSLRRVSLHGEPELVLLEDDAVLWNPIPTQDSRLVYFWRGDPPDNPPKPGVPLPEAWRMPIDGGNPELVARDCGPLDLDPTGTKLLCADDVGSRVVAIETGAALWTGPFLDYACFSPRGEIAFMNRPDPNVMLQALDSTAPRPLTSLESHQTMRFAFSPDGATLLLSRDHRSIDVLMIENLP